MASNPSRYRTPQEMFPVIESYLESGLGRQAFCHSWGLSQAVLGYWLRKYRQKNQLEPSGFVSLRVEPEVSSVGLELVFPDGLLLRFPAGTPAGYVAPVLKSIQDA